MAAFIENDNQKLLWNTLHNVPLFLNNVEESQRPILFKQIIGEFYQKNRFRALNKNDLDLLNRNVISHFMELLKKAFVNNAIESSNNLQQKYSHFVEPKELNAIEIHENEKNVSWEDQNNSKILQKIIDLENSVLQLKTELSNVKNKVYGEEVVLTVDKIINSTLE